jgi:hypothetical protein
MAGSRIESASLDRALNSALADADISESFEAYLDIVDRFYADDVQVTSDPPGEPIIGKAPLRSLLVRFLIPIHVLAEAGGLSVSVRHQSIPSDTRDGAHTAWEVKLVGVTGSTCVLTWSVVRKWDQSKVIYEHHYDRHVEGGPLGVNDFYFGEWKPGKAGKPS